MTNSKLVVFNLKSCQTDPIFSASVLWVQELSNRFSDVEVYSVHLGSVPKIANVRWRELGGGSNVTRLHAIWRILLFLSHTIFSRDRFVVFHYMSHKTAVFPGLFLRLMKIHQVLWYAHASKTLSLSLAEKIVNKVVTSRKTAFPIESKKVTEIGQALTFALPERLLPVWKNRKNEIVSLGRLARAKRLEECLAALENPSLPHHQLSNIGPQTDLDYKAFLDREFIGKRSRLLVLPQLPHKEAILAISNYRYYFSGTRNAIDKSAIEAASVGCLILTTNSNLQEILEIETIFSGLGIKGNIGSQLAWYSQLPVKEIEDLQERIVNHVRKQLSLSCVVDRLMRVLNP